MTSGVGDKPQQASEVLIEGRLYDVASFKHPGGTIIQYLQGGGDATEAFREFHMRSRRARKALAALPNRPAPPAAAPTAEAARLTKLSQDFAKLRRQLETEGWFAPAPLHVVYRLVELVVLHAIGIAMLVSGVAGLVLPALLVLGIAEGRCGWLMHEGGHNSLTGIIAVDRKIQELVYGVGCGMSGAWWRSQHNKHHATPQKLKHDVDLDTLPLVAFNKAISARAKKSPLLRSWLSMQAYLFAPITCSLVAAFWQFFLHPRHMIRTRRYTELAALVIRAVAVVAIARAADATVAGAVFAYFVYNFFGSTYIFVDFALSHTHLDVTQPDEHVHWVEYGAKYTMNVAPHWFTNWWMSYLNFQIEHHLFPSMPQFRFASLHPRVRALFAANGLKYDCRGYFASLRDTFRNLDEVGHV